VLGQLLRLGDDANASLDAMRVALEGAPVLAEAVCRVGNSDLYALPGRITRLQRAVHVLGPRPVIEIATSCWALHEFGPDVLEVGLCAQSLALSIESSADLDARLAGLLHRCDRASRIAWAVPARLCGLVEACADPVRARPEQRMTATLVDAARTLLTGRTLPMSAAGAGLDRDACADSVERARRDAKRFTTLLP